MVRGWGLNSTGVVQAPMKGPHEHGNEAWDCT